MTVFIWAGDSAGGALGMQQKTSLQCQRHHMTGYKGHPENTVMKG